MEQYIVIIKHCDSIRCFGPFTYQEADDFENNQIPDEIREESGFEYINIICLSKEY